MVVLGQQGLKSNRNTFPATATLRRILMEEPSNLMALILSKLSPKFITTSMICDQYHLFIQSTSELIMNEKKIAFSILVKLSIELSIMKI
jgi:hypothetical protein